MSTPRRSSGNNPVRGGGERRVEVAVEHQTFSGPLPHPAILQQYNDIQPDFAERILKLTEAEAAHRHDIVRRAMRLNAIETFLGQIFGLTVALAGFATTVWLGLAGQSDTASIVGGTTVVGLVTVFVTGRRGRPQENEETDR
ncbi:DUF2335 domain-containing protein [uncultured Thiocystis sp.]|jgi:uncharacterized membrane protein|uniref:DUF2335 domain-containing protein n=1 Tax=uncultured Thiocystis sp. TaxID=1202134 RepID=UPI0025ECC10C|nr:DUF2335 domain-containing protein [uncultured Thiocystis sp.]